MNTVIKIISLLFIYQKHYATSNSNKKLLEIMPSLLIHYFPTQQSIWYFSPKSTNRLFFFQLSQLWYHFKQNYHHRFKRIHSKSHLWRNKVKVNRNFIQLLFILSNSYFQWAVQRNISCLFFYQWIFLFYLSVTKSKLISNL